VRGEIFAKSPRTSRLVHGSSSKAFSTWLADSRLRPENMSLNSNYNNLSSLYPLYNATRSSYSDIVIVLALAGKVCRAWKCDQL
jgi:hypothetical protein